MFRPPDSETPADEYERLLALRQAEAKRTVKTFAAIAGVLHGMSIACLCALVMTNEDGFAVLCLILWCASAIAAVLAGVMTLRRWSVLSGGWIALGLLPWGVVASELSLPILALLLYTI